MIISKKTHEKVEKNFFMAIKQVGMKSIEKVSKNLFNASDSKIVFRSEDK